MSVLNSKQKAWVVPRMWAESKEVHIIAGGPSILAYKDKLPKFLKDKRVIGVNNSYLLGDFVDVCFFGDHTWYTWHRERLEGSPCIPVSLHRSVLKPGVLTVNVDRRTTGLSGRQDTLCWNRNSGACAIDLARALGASKIYLYGYDMQKQGAQTHWHGGHKERKAPESKVSPYKAFLTCFPIIKKDAERLGVQIFNVNEPGATGLQIFPIIRPGDLL